MKILALITLLLSGSAANASCVILLHGLARTEASMSELETRLVEAEYQVINDHYPSREFGIEKLAATVVPSALEKCQPDAEVSFVTHSLGGIVLRQYLSQHEIPHLNHVVMLGPPNQGSEVVDKLGAVPGFHFLNGDAGLDLGTDDLSAPNRLGPANFDVGIIAGSRSINWILSMLIPGDDDGKVSIERTKLEGMDDHLVLPVSHPFIMGDDEVIEQVIHYLDHGRFRRDTNARDQEI